MFYIAIFIVGALIGYAAGKIDQFIDGMDEQRRCTQDCNQGRNCTCEDQAAEDEAPVVAPLPAPTLAFLEAQLVDLRDQQATILSRPAKSLDEVVLRQALGESIEKLERMAAEERARHESSASEGRG